MKKRYSREEKSRHWQQWQLSGQSQKAYCESHGLNMNSFKSWRPERGPYPMVPIKVQAPQIQPMFQVQWHEAVIEVRGEVSSEQWRNLLSAMAEKRGC